MTLRSFITKHRLLCFCFALQAGSGSSAMPQTTATGRIMVRVAGAAVPGTPRIALLRGATGVSLAVAVNEEGVAQFPPEPYGRYTVSIGRDVAEAQASDGTSINLGRPVLEASVAVHPVHAAAAPRFAASGMAGTTAPSGYSSGMSAETEQHTRTILQKASQLPPGCEALARMLAAHASSPSDPAALHTLAQAYLLRGNYKAALELVLPKAANDANAAGFAAVAYAGRGHSGSAIAMCRQSDKLSSQSNHACGAALLPRWPALALLALSPYLEVHPQSATAWLARGQALALQGDNGEAARALLQSIALDPDDSAAYTLLGTLPALPPELASQAVARLRQHAVIDDDDPSAHTALAQALWRGGYAPTPEVREEAVSQLDRALALDQTEHKADDTDTLQLFADIRQSEGNLEQALHLYQRAAAAAPAGPELMYHIALLERRLHHTAAAQAAMSRFVAQRHSSATESPIPCTAASGLGHRE